MEDQGKESQIDMSSGKVLLGRPGIVVLSPSLEVLHMNRQAHLLICDMVPTTPEAQQPNHRTEAVGPTASRHERRTDCGGAVDGQR
jgi:hypothetical protein